MIPSWLRLSSVQIDDIAILPSDWTAQIESVANTFGARSMLDSSSPTSLEPAGTLIELKVVHGSDIARNLPWLFEVYSGPMLEFASMSFGKRLYPCNSIDDAVNINIISGVGGRYEWHVDTNPVTGLLFLSSLDEKDGGALVFKKGNADYIVRPSRGMFHCFDATDTPHRVEPLLRNISRISVPMNYYADSNNSGRDKELQNYLHKKA